jgi:hypothetical protein
MHIFRCAKFRWKISKNKIRHFWQCPIIGNGPLWNIFLITEWITLKPKIITNKKMRFKKKQTFSRSAQLVVLWFSLQVSWNLCKSMVSNHDLVHEVIFYQTITIISKPLHFPVLYQTLQLFQNHYTFQYCIKPYNYFKTITLSSNSLFQTMKANYEVFLQNHGIIFTIHNVHSVFASFATPNPHSSPPLLAKVNLVASVLHQLASNAKNRNILLRI